MKDLFEKIKNEISIENMYRHMDVLVNDIGERLSGSDELKKTANYIENELKECGLNAWTDHFPMYQSYPIDAKLIVTSPKTITVDAEPVCHIASTLPSGIEGELIYLGSGSYKDYEGIDVRDKIILTNMNWTPGRPEKARIAWEMGAKALIIMNWGKADSSLIQMGAVKSQWGNPTPESFQEIPKITVISISRAAGEELMELCESGSVKVWLKAEATREWITADQPTAYVKGGNSKGQYVLVGSHIDAWGKSAICNASGNALNMELARVFYKYREELKRDIVFIFWDGHEIAEGGGSTWYCDRYWKTLTENCVAYINMDNLAIKGTTEPGVESLPELKAYLMDSIEMVWNRKGIWHHAYKGGGDSSFFGVGVPYISFATEYTEEKLKELNYAFYSPWLHSNSDTIDKIDRELYVQHINYFYKILFDLVNQDLIPYDLGAMAQNIKEQFEVLSQTAGNASVYLEELEKAVEAYVAMADKIEHCKSSLKILKDKAHIELLNKIMLEWEKETTVFRNEAGRYGQDPCCYLQAEKPIPALEKAVRSLNSYPIGSHEYYLWETKVMREANRAFDALNNSVRYAELALSFIPNISK